MTRLGHQMLARTWGGPICAPWAWQARGAVSGLGRPDLCSSCSSCAWRNEPVILPRVCSLIPPPTAFQQRSVLLVRCGCGILRKVSQSFLNGFNNGHCIFVAALNCSISISSSSSVVLAYISHTWSLSLGILYANDYKTENSKRWVKRIFQRPRVIQALYKQHEDFESIDPMHKAPRICSKWNRWTAGTDKSLGDTRGQWPSQLF